MPTKKSKPASPKKSTKAKKAARASKPAARRAGQSEDMTIIAEIAVYSTVDPTMKAQLKSNPTAVLEAQGVQVPANLKIKVVEDTESAFNVVVPEDPLPPDSQLQALPTNPTPYQIAIWIITQVQNNTPLKGPLLGGDAVSVLRSMGIFIPAGITISVWQDTPTLHHMALPFVVGAPPSTANVSPLLMAAAAEKTNVNVDVSMNATQAINAAQAVNAVEAVNVEAALQVSSVLIAAEVIVIAVI